MKLLTIYIGRISLLVSVIVLLLIPILPVASLGIESGGSGLVSAGGKSDASDKAIVPEKLHNRDTGTVTQNENKVGNKANEQITTSAQRTTSGIGGWISIDAFSKITKFKLILSLILLIAVVYIDRMVGRLINQAKHKIEDGKGQHGIRYLMMDAASKPISMFIWIYGMYVVVTPSLVYFQQQNGANIVKSIAQKGVDFSTAVAVVWLIVRLMSIVEYYINNWSSSSNNNIDKILAPLIGKTLRVFTVVIGSILIIQNLTGVKIGPLLASLGIGGIAIALAAKDSIANLFGTLTILFDKPFKIGERVEIDDKDGFIDAVGFRSTRIRLLSGPLVIIPNEKVVNSTVENIGRRPFIRWKTTLSITYDTPVDKVEKAVTILKEILDNHKGMEPNRPPRVYFNGFGEWSLNILVMAWYHPPKYWEMQSWRMETCLEILKQFNEAGVQFAFPSRSVYLANDDRRQLKLKMLQGETEMAAYDSD